MSWRVALTTALAGVDEIDAVRDYWPQSGDAFSLGEVAAVLTSPGRRSERSPGELVATVSMPVTLVTVAGDDYAAAMSLVDAAVDAVDAAMERHVTLTGAATAAGPISWEPGDYRVWPPNSGLLLAAQTGTIDIVLVSSPLRVA